MKIITGIWEITPTETTKFLQLCNIAKQYAEQENGCISFNYYENKTVENTFLFLEEWKDQQAIDFHIEQWYFKEFMQNAEPLLTEKPAIKIYDIEKITEL
jgi:quinol monooxygenase YgiN